MMMDWKKGIPRSLSLGLAFGFFLGVLQADPFEENLSAVMHFFYLSLPIGVLVGLVLGGALEKMGGETHPLDALLLASYFLYLGFLKTLGWGFIPWVAVGFALVAGILSWFLGIRAWKGKIILLFHVMGYMSALYLFLHLKRYFEGWDITLANIRLFFQWIF